MNVNRKIAVVLHNLWGSSSKMGIISLITRAGIGYMHVLRISGSALYR